MLHDYTEFHGESHLPAVLFGGECRSKEFSVYLRSHSVSLCEMLLI